MGKCKTCGVQLEPGRRRCLRCRLLARIDRSSPDGCWPWTGAHDRRGYGQLQRGAPVARGLVIAHRAAWEVFRGPIPDGLWVLHRCDNPPCCNPDHLFLGDVKANALDRAAKGRGRAMFRAGEGHPQAKLTEERIKVMRAMVGRGLSHADIAWLMKLSKGAVRHALTGLNWGHLPQNAPSFAAWTKLTPDKAREIRTLYAAGGVSQADLARAFSVDNSVISRVVRGEIWREPHGHVG